MRQAEAGSGAVVGVEKGVGHEVARVALAAAHACARDIEQHLRGRYGRARDTGKAGRDRLLDGGHERGIGNDGACESREGGCLARGDDRPGVAGRGDDTLDLARSVEYGVEPADVPVVARGGDEVDGPAIGVRGLQRILALDRGELAGQDLERSIDGGVLEQGVTAAGDGDVHAAQQRDDGHVALEALEVADEDDLVDAPREQAIDLGLDGGRGRGQVGRDGDVPGDGDGGQARSGRAHQAEARAGDGIVEDHRAPDHPATGDRDLDQPVVVDEIAEAELTGEVEVGAQEGLALEAANEALEDVGRSVELVVADDVGVVGDGALGHRIEERATLPLAADERGRREVCIARVHGQDRVAVRARSGQLPLDHGPVGGDPRDRQLHGATVGLDGVRKGQQGRFAVVVEQEGEGHPAALRPRDLRAGVSGQRGEQHQRCQGGESCQRYRSHVRQGRTAGRPPAGLDAGYRHRSGSGRFISPRPRYPYQMTSST